MALYYFHTQTETRSTDSDGIDLGTPREARAQAIITCGQMLKDSPDAFWGTRPWAVVVTDAKGLILWELSMDGISSPAGLALD
ncbi:DUF6894 family protein [Sphingomonas montana]|uniref:DUF6894 family protein n=1 Tax=Sphingomonas montana TaxID=1843236 RepID=UPI00096FD46E|nr:hypothetical protein [Sphingomonas montana]